ncbi:hypothetical protein GH714_038712 [Hevea brasiliensis]|uniref:RNase H type-1 domain-containing protein n=1 Tax=Hevea brasiliensis TaxID=3981 RepID=A0A6A6KX02_HEVBR|nr:hypothetical protein GH714_038712 [Hevea brasiliensis]
MGWWKLNCDGSMKSSDNLATAGALIRDYNGNWLSSLAVNLGRCFVLHAELWALLEGVTDPPRNAISLVMAIKSLLQSDWVVHVSHIWLEGNFVVDCLTTLAGSLPFGLHEFQQPPTSLLPWLSHDKFGVGYSRTVKM